MKKQDIRIKEANVGKFGVWCNKHGHNGVTTGCIEEGLASRLAEVRKMAQFAENVRKWNK